MYKLQQVIVANYNIQVILLGTGICHFQCLADIFGDNS